MPSYLWPITSPPPVLAGYKLMMSRPCMCFTSMYIQNLSAAHVSTMAWRLVCTSCHPSLASYGMSHFLASHSLKPAPFGAGPLLSRGLFLLQSTLLLFSAIFVCPVVLLYHSCFSIVWPKPAGPLWACCLFFPQWPSIVIWTFWLRWASLAHLLSLGSFDPFPCFAFSLAFTNSFELPWSNYLILHPWGSWTFHQPLTFLTFITSSLL